MARDVSAWATLGVPWRLSSAWTCQGCCCVPVAVVPDSVAAAAGIWSVYVVGSGSSADVEVEAVRSVVVVQDGY